MERTDPIAHAPGVSGPAFALAALLFLVPAGCDWSTQSDYRDRLSAVNSVTAPDSVKLGSDFDAVIATWGSNGCWRKGHDSVKRLGDLLVQIVPYDREYVGGGGCTQNIVSFEHVVPITATERGQLHVEVRARFRSVAGKDSAGVIEKLVTVY